MTRFADFKPLCRTTPSYPWCNLFYKQLLDHSPADLKGLSNDTTSAPVGIDPICGILRVGQEGSISNIANIVVCAVSILITAGLIFATSRRKAAVGRSELRIFLVLYLCTLPFQLLTTGSLFEQGSTALVALTAIHAGFVVALFWTLLGNGIVSTQVVEDGTPASLVPFGIFTIAFFVGGLYVALDVGLGFTDTLGPSDPPSDLNNIALFVLTSIWPLAATLIYFILMAYIVMAVLKEFKPFIYYIIAAICFILSQLAYFLLGRVICNGSNAKVDGSFVATILETAAVVVLYLAWRSITEESWDEDYYNGFQFQ